MTVLALSLWSYASGGDLVGTIPKNEQIPDLPFHLYQGYLVVVEGRIGNLDHQNLLLDTGTSPSMIDSSAAKKLDLSGTADGISLFNKQIAAERIVLHDLQIGPLRRRDFQVMVADFSKIANDLGTHLDGVIGLDVLGAQSFTIDYKKQRISFHASRQRHSAPFSAGPQFITVKFNTGNRELHLLVDTGTPHLVIFKQALQDLDYEWSPVTGSGKNLSGIVSYRDIILPKAMLGAEIIGPERASVVVNQKNVETEYDGLIGVSLLRPNQLSFDFENRVLGWNN
ncbi:MAG TPA: retropepsin-like aspartic protease [Candidatus Sulfotelmatobacter sp.]|nr:retropepsin-like aspartic protease [Candidatus Sulfotelmatobacter sp.]